MNKKQEPKSKPCPNCGYHECPHCGKPIVPERAYPVYPIYPLPWHQWMITNIATFGTDTYFTTL